jgi:hypothetical protein
MKALNSNNLECFRTIDVFCSLSHGGPLSFISSAAERMARRSISRIKKDAEEFTRYDQELYNIIMNRSVAYASYSSEEEDQLDEEEESYELAYASKISEIQNKLSIVLELLRLHKTSLELNRDLNEIKSNEGGTYKVTFEPQWESFECKGRDKILSTISALENLFYDSNEKSPAALDIEHSSAEKQKRLRELLSGTAHWVSVESKKIGRAPSKENDIQVAMRTLLQSHFFDEYLEGFTIPKYVKNFKPDGGVTSIRTAIEYKFIDSKEELARATGAIFEDVIGYGGSRDWEFFYSVFYMTESFADPVALTKSLAKNSGSKWHPIVVIGEKQQPATSDITKVKKK